MKCSEAMGFTSQGLRLGAWGESPQRLPRPFCHLRTWPAPRRLAPRAWSPGLQNCGREVAHYLLFAPHPLNSLCLGFLFNWCLWLCFPLKETVHIPETGFHHYNKK
mgnify:CR=1 FL=1